MLAKYCVLYCAWPAYCTWYHRLGTCLKVFSGQYSNLIQMCLPSLTGLCLASSLRTSGAIHPSVPGTPDLLLKLCLPAASFLHRPKSEIMARTRPWAFGMDTRMLCGFRSLWTTEKQRTSLEEVKLRIYCITPT